MVPVHIPQSLPHCSVPFNIILPRRALRFHCGFPSFTYVVLLSFIVITLVSCVLWFASFTTVARLQGHTCDSLSLACMYYGNISKYLLIFRCINGLAFSFSRITQSCVFLFASFTLTRLQYSNEGDARSSVCFYKYK